MPSQPTTVAARGWPRPTLSPLALNILVSVYLLATCNATFWRGLGEVMADRPVAMAGLGAAYSLWLFFFVALLAVRRAQKPVLAIFVVIAALSSYYQDVLGAYLDKAMMQNVFSTTIAEGQHLLTWGLLGHFLLRAIPGLALVLWPRVRRGPLGRSALRWVGINAGALALIVLILAPNLRQYITTIHDHHELVRSMQPLAPLAGTLGYGRMMFNARQVVVKPYGRDAVMGPALESASKPVLLVIVAGETARAANWSLSGYERPTNPELAQRDIIYYPRLASCGTGTAVSLPCMFSPLTRKTYSYRAGLETENLLDVLGHAGFKIQWWDNNTGDKNVAKRFHVRRMRPDDDPAACTRGECMDDVFLPALKELADSITQDTVLVLHQIGSHGPSYWLRYPPQGEAFKPACHSSELADCSREEIVNAYDNTILHTDWFLAQVIDTLKATSRIESAMLYVSDHGESLGEGGFYLHSAPYAIAPDVQKEVPMVLWLSPALRQTLRLDEACLKAHAAEPASHDNLFSTVLGLIDVQTQVRDRALDLTAGCRMVAPG